MAEGRRFTGVAVLVILAASLTFASAPAAQRSLAAPTPSLPNVVVIVTDDQRYDSMSNPIPGTSFDPMPRLNGILRAGEAIKFTHGYVSNALCCPSRASLLTGAASHTTGVYKNNWGSRCLFPGDLRPRGCGGRAFGDDHTLATWLDSKGYETAIVGKYLNDYPGGLTKLPGWDQGHVFSNHEIRSAPSDNYTVMDVQEWSASPGVTNGLYCGIPPPGESCLSYPGVGVGDQFYGTDLWLRMSLDFIQQAAPAPDPFFLYVGLNAPHTGKCREEVDSNNDCSDNPREEIGPVPPQYRVPLMYEGLPDALNDPTLFPAFNEADISDKPYWMDRNAENRKLGADRQKMDVAAAVGLREDTYRAVLGIDDAVGSIYDELSATGELDNTLFIFLSDNGFLWGEHRLQKKVVGYEESIRVPFVILPPKDALPARVGTDGDCSYGGVGSAGSCLIEDAPVSLMDVAPTVLQLAGFQDATNPESCVGHCSNRPEGVSLVPLLSEDLDGADAPRTDVFFESGQWDSADDTDSHNPPSYCGVRTGVDHPPVAWGSSTIDVADYLYIAYSESEGGADRFKMRDLYYMGPGGDPSQLVNQSGESAHSAQQRWLDDRLFGPDAPLCAGKDKPPSFTIPRS